MQPQHFVDLTRYPITDPESPPTKALQRRVSDELDQRGACELPGFITDEGVRFAAAQCAALASQAHPSRSRATAYLSGPDHSFAAGHPRTVLMDSSVRVVGYDQFPGDHALRQLYEWQPLMQFVASVLGLPAVYRYADPMGALNLAVMGAGDVLGWHFDQTDFVISIPLVAAEVGGDFEVHPLIRSAYDECYDAVGRAVRDERTDALRLPMRAGSLLLFRGRNSLHRVTAIRGERERLVALLAYDAHPGTDSSVELKLARYGRTVPLA